VPTKDENRAHYNTRRHSCYDENSAPAVHCSSHQPPPFSELDSRLGLVPDNAGALASRMKS